MAKELSARYILEYLKKQEESGIENHALLIMQGEDIVFEQYASPYSAQMPHTLFSVTKSIVSTAAGFAVAEGLISLDSKIQPLFPEYRSCRSDKWDNLTFRSVLTMQSNKEFTFLQNMTGDYNEIFMRAPFRKKEGFLYSNNDAHIVASVIQRLSGQTLTEYLKPRLFEPLGIDTPFWETNSLGECIGGTGCYLKARDLAKICRCYADGGMYNGKQVIPEFWCREATKIQVEFKNEGENQEGYGYLFWIKNNIFSMTGMFGQLISYIPQFDAVVVSLNCCLEEGVNSRLAEEVLIKAFDGESTPEDKQLLEQYLQARGVKPVVCKDMPRVNNNRVYRITRLSDVVAGVMFPQSIIPRSLTCSFAKRPKSNLNNVSFNMSDGALDITWYEEEDKVTVFCGLDGNPRLSECEIKGYVYKIWAYAYTENGILKAVVKPINTLSTQYISIDFKGKAVKIGFKCTPSFTDFIKKQALSPSFFNRHKLIKKCAERGLDFILATTERPVKFKTNG